MPEDVFRNFYDNLQDISAMALPGDFGGCTCNGKFGIACNGADNCLNGYDIYRKIDCVFAPPSPPRRPTPTPTGRCRKSACPWARGSVPPRWR